MAPLEQQRKPLRSVYEHQDAIDGLRIEERLYEGGTLNSKHKVRDVFGLSARGGPNFFDDYPVAAAAAVTPTPSIAYGSGVSHPLSSSVGLTRIIII
jgi:hypothetical protein